MAEKMRKMRSIYWGLILTIAGICSYILLSLVASQIYPAQIQGYAKVYRADEDLTEFGIIRGIIYLGYHVSIPPFYIALMYIAKFVMFFSLPFATAIETRRLLKGRKSEAKENE